MEKKDDRTRVARQVVVVVVARQVRVRILVPVEKVAAMHKAILLHQLMDAVAASLAPRPSLAPKGKVMASLLVKAVPIHLVSFGRRTVNAARALRAHSCMIQALVVLQMEMEIGVAVLMAMLVAIGVGAAVLVAMLVATGAAMLAVMLVPMQVAIGVEVAALQMIVGAF